ncbi:UNVERIFIED_ORG: dihydrolipoamide dehydrogenase [Burkholderia sp. CF145]|uniref:dihydrolipoyl dehydrogenase n=1 Tax=Paraburkholderia hospita TaxID=169430 RepID=UPI000271AECD|nr:dihydrolipoyl dehydrogenase [Paraburkholderia hospita]EUC18950.1 Dihydrolipoyl dehydrogenase [Burkholderia sp. BT03]SKC65901.1 Pyruvate/2-oxoglutarate dehydrogenase complex, dihydrolipoamide dehydrogenase (E3) component [Paraburkholderia hospita]
MKTLHIDVAVIGAGSAGLSAFRAAKAAGASVVLIEGGAYGTTCARVGCMPSKLLIAAAEAAHAARRMAPFGVHVDGAVRVDGREVMARVKGERDRFVGFVVESTESIPNEERLIGYAQFIDDNVLQVGEHTRVHAKRVVIATGSSPYVPAMYQALGDRAIVNDDVFAWDDLPRKVAVIGAGVIGLELGQALAWLGVDVTMLGARGRVGPLSDPAIKNYARDVFRDSFHFETHAQVEAATREGDSVRLRYRDGVGELHEDTFDYVLVTAGRRPNMDKLALHNTTLEVDARGVPVFDPLTLQAGKHPVFIAGDANDVLPLLHEAADEGRAAGDNAARYPDVKPLVRRAAISVVFSEPGIAMVGARFLDLADGSFVTGEVSFEDQGRSRVMLRNRGLMHVYVDRDTRRFVGAEWIGPDAEHIAHLLSWALQMGLSVDAMLAMPFYHPVVEEGLRSALRSAAAQLAVM